MQSTPTNKRSVVQYSCEQKVNSKMCIAVSFPLQLAAHIFSVTSPGPVALLTKFQVRHTDWLAIGLLSLLSLLSLLGARSLVGRGRPVAYCALTLSAVRLFTSHLRTDQVAMSEGEPVSSWAPYFLSVTPHAILRHGLGI